MRIVGQSVPRLDGPLKATGQAQYTGDVILPRMLHGKMVRSPHAHARILNVDASRARQVPGVRAVLTPADLGDVRMGPDQGLLPGDRVLFIGEEVAAVAALNEDAAEEAVSLIEVEYEPLEPLLDFRQSRLQPALHPHAPDNIAHQIHMHFGDVQHGFEASDVVQEGTIAIEPSQNCFMERHIAVATYDATGKLTVWSPTQTAHFLRRDLGKALGMSEGDVRAIATFTGGAFSGRTGTMPHHYLAALLSMRSGCPVRIDCTREEEFVAYRGGPAMDIRVKLGCRRDGTLQAVEVEALNDSGAYTTNQQNYVYLGGVYASFPYRIPNLKYDGYMVYTNNPPYGTHHGGGIVQVRYAVALMLDSLAREIGMDSTEIMRLNALQPGDITAPKFKITSCGLTECIDRARDQSGWSRDLAQGMACGGAASGSQALGMALGGAASGGTGRAPRDTSAAMVRMNDDGTVSLLVGIPEIGQGSNTALAQIAAEELGIRLSRVRVISADTDITPVDLGAFAQRGTFITGNAVKAAARQLKEHLLNAAADRLEARAEDLEIEDEEIYVKGSPERRQSFLQAVEAIKASEQGQPLVGVGSYVSPSERANRQTWEGNISGAYSFHAQVAQVQLDRETGLAQVSRVVAAHDCGFAINPLLVEGQIEGQAWAGMCQALYERKIMADGQVMNCSLLDYKLPTSLDSPPVEAIIVESIDPNGPFGAKECGEGPVMAAAPAVGNALQSAMCAPVRRLPMGPEDILEALGDSSS